MDEILRAPQEEFPLHTQRKGRAPSAQGGREKAERAGERFRKLMEAGAAQGRVFRLQGIRVYHRTRSAVAGRPKMAPLPFLALTAVIGIAAVVGTMYTPAYVVTVDGVDVRQMPQSTLRGLLGYVPQKGVLFSGTIDSNLKFGGENITDADVRTAARIAQAEEFISAKPEGYESPIAQGGTNVSGGQKQRLSIARAIAKHPKIYLFDDSFSALDYKTDVALRRALKAETGDATVIIVAQRISTVLHANQILVLEDGRIVGKGTHAQLMESCPAYQEIARSQLSNKELDLKGGEA